MQANVSATRMEMLRLRRKVELAERGHKLLSQKRDELSRQLVQISRGIAPLRREVEKALNNTSRRFMLARASMEPEDVAAALEVPVKKFNLAVQFASVMNVKVPSLEKKLEGDVICYGYAKTSPELDAALYSLEKVFDMIIELAEKEKQAYLLATDLQKTRRRVNVLEHVVIPETKDTIKYIASRLSENERDNTSRLMIIADIIRGDQ
ncbi:V-type sodium pump subunit D [Sedimentisphaera cyanobacteriorum]|uniref:V-type ATP synthase subunit D n=1 Tax=Sedimentisphaera cyanobacteriorum TaxID=1940790 RepID=A0A1Q2HMJ9_9BACT|nr:V-type ATP synthase subunit D [Sedimentisphaera cyanobacteriorum]AQQ08687.1 V-type sodium pump subunit D [Sedimentisphaera cyanobacteriorum]